MDHNEFRREEIPSDGVSIGGDEACDHARFRRVGSDGGGNIYFNCTSCSRVILNYDTTATDDSASQSQKQDSELYPDDNSNPQHNPLMKGLSFDSDAQDHETGQKRGGSTPSDTGIIGRLKAALDELLPSKRE